MVDVSSLIATSAFVKKKRSKIRNLKIRETNGGQWDVKTSAFVKKKSSKMRHLKKIVKPMEVKLRRKI